MIETLNARIEQMKAFDEQLVSTLKEVQLEVNKLGVSLDPNKLSSDKSVRSHIRKRTQKVNNLIKRFIKNFNALIEEVESNEVE